MFDLFERLADRSLGSNIGFISSEGVYKYSEINEGINQEIITFRNAKIINSVVILHGDFDYKTIVSFFALLKLKNIVLLLTESLMSVEDIAKLVNADYYLYPRKKLKKKFNKTKKSKLINQLIFANESGLILLSSGTTGKPKAILHATQKLFRKFEYSKKRFRTLAFLLFDHIAGLDTMLYTFSAGGTLIALEKRTPDEVINILKENEVEVFPTSPSFLNILLLNPEFSFENIPALKIITFGSERISNSTLKKLMNRFSNIKILQKYGLTEMGSPRVQSRQDDPSWIKIDLRQTQYKIEDDILFLRSESSMIGYIYEDGYELFDGWFNTQDKVEVDGEWIKILGRTTDIINVGGQKVYPAEVESVLLEMSNVKEVSVFAKDNPIMGKVVGARFSLFEDEKIRELKKRIRKFCKDRLEPFKIPVYVEITKYIQVSNRFKKVR